MGIRSSIIDNEIKILGDLIITPLIKAQTAFNEALSLKKSAITRDATIQRFEFTFELAWKTLKRILKYKGVQLNNPRDTIREAAKEGLIDNPNEWFNFLEYRNLTSHTYDEEVAEKIYAGLIQFSDSLEKLTNTILAL